MRLLEYRSGRTPARADERNTWSKDRVNRNQIFFGRRIGVGEDGYVEVDAESERLAKAYAKGDKKAGDELYRRHGLEQFFKKFQSEFTEEQIEDAESLAWKNILASLRGGVLDRGVTFKQVLMNNANWAGKKIFREESRHAATSLDNEINSAEAESPTFKDNLEAKIDAQKQIYEVLERFDPTTREMLELKAEGKSQKELAEKYGVQVGDIAVWLSAVKEDLKTGRDPASARIAARLTARSTMTSQVNDFQQEDPVPEDHINEKTEKKSEANLRQRSVEYRLIKYIAGDKGCVRLES